MATKAELESANRELVLELNRANSAIENLKKEVVEKARDLASEHGWCEVVDTALEDLGLVANQRKVLLLTIKLPVIITDDKEWEAEDLAQSITWNGTGNYWQGAYMPDVDELDQDGVKVDQSETTTYEAVLVDQ